MVDFDLREHLPAKALRELLAALEKEVAQHLTTNGVYDVLAYGWLDYDTPDPEYRGLAIWQTSAPFDPDWSALLNGGTVAYAPTPLDEALTRTW